MKITVLTSALCLLGLFAKADSIQIASNVYMAACPTSNSYLTNLSRANSAVLANADAKAYVAAGNPDRALARYGFKNAVGIS